MDSVLKLWNKNSQLRTSIILTIATLILSSDHLLFKVNKSDQFWKRTVKLLWQLLCKVLFLKTFILWDSLGSLLLLKDALKSDNTFVIGIATCSLLPVVAFNTTLFFTCRFWNLMRRDTFNIKKDLLWSIFWWRPLPLKIMQSEATP